MRAAYNHFPINITLGKESVEVRNFLGERKTRKVKMLDGVSIKKSDNVKDELVLEGNDIEKVASSAALLHESCLVKNKDIRKFLDGIVSARHAGSGAPPRRARERRGCTRSHLRRRPPPRRAFPSLPSARLCSTCRRRAPRTTSSRSSDGGGGGCC